MRLSRYILAGALAGLALGLLTAPKAAHADAVAQRQGSWVRLTLGACKNEAVVAELGRRGEHADAFRAAESHINGTDFAACWRPGPGGAFVVFEDGDDVLLPADAFKPTPQT